MMPWVAEQTNGRSEQNRDNRCTEKNCKTQTIFWKRADSHWTSQIWLLYILTKGLYRCSLFFSLLCITDQKNALQALGPGLDQFLQSVNKEISSSGQKKGNP